MPRGFDEVAGALGADGGGDGRLLAALTLPEPRRAISCLMVVSAPSSSTVLSIARKPAAAIESRTLLLSIGTSIEVPDSVLPSIEILAFEAADDGVMSTVTLMVEGGLGAGATVGVGAGVGVGSAAVATTVGGGVGLLGSSVAAAVTPVPSPNRRPQNTPTASPADTTIGTARGVRRCVSPIRLNYACSAANPPLLL